VKDIAESKKTIKELQKLIDKREEEIKQHAEDLLREYGATKIEGFGIMSRDVRYQIPCWEGPKVGRRGLHAHDIRRSSARRAKHQSCKSLTRSAPHDQALAAIRPKHICVDLRICRTLR
jgi:hypothetical protein